MNITSAQYTTNVEGDNVAIKCIVDGETLHIPLDSGNRIGQKFSDRSPPVT